MRAKYAEAVASWRQLTFEAEHRRFGARVLVWIAVLLSIGACLALYAAGMVRDVLIVVVGFLLVLAVGLFIPISRRRRSRTALPQPLPASSDVHVEGRLGPNGYEVAAFLEQLALLTPDHWRRIEDRSDDDGLSAWAALRRQKRAQRAWARVTDLPFEGLEPQDLILAIETRVEAGHIPFEPPFRPYEAARLAATALAFRPLFTDEEFATLYHAFEPIIPAATLRPPQR